MNALAWRIWNALQLLATVTWSAGCITLALIVYLVTRSQRPPLIMARRLWAPFLLSGAGARIQVRGAERVDWTRSAIVVANHQSVIDICALFVAVPVPLRFVLKKELARLPFVGWYARAMGMVFIDRAASRRTRHSLARVTELTRRGAMMAAFPEGTRSHAGKPGRFRPGVFAAAIEAGVPVVPVALEGTGDVLPPGGFRVRPGTIRVTVGQPLATNDLDPEDRATLAKQARQRIAELMSAQSATFHNHAVFEHDG